VGRRLKFKVDDYLLNLQEMPMSIMPQGEDLRKAVKWISEMRQVEPQTSPQKWVDQACLKFNLSPVDAEYLSRWVKGID
jgi:hypothetical protein